MDNNSLVAVRFTSGKKETSPLRRKGFPGKESARKESQGKYTNRGHGTIDEEELYNIRREEEIRRQLQQKDAELQNLNKASDYLRVKLEKRQREPNDVPKFQQNQPERDKSPYSLNVSRDVQPVAFTGAPQHVKEHINNLQSDNSGLMRRLNLVLQELDRVQREKEELYQRLEECKNMQQDMQRMLNGDDKMDKVNRYMQDDLVYERDRNLKVRQKIKDEEIVRNDFLRELRKSENDHTSGMNDNQTLSAEMQKKSNQIQDLEKEHYYTQEKIRQIQNQIEQTKLEEMHVRGEKNDLSTIIEQLMQERSNLLERLDNLTRRYDECVKEISQDRAEMEAHNKHHAKLITAKILFQSLELMQKSRVHQGFVEFKQYCLFDAKCHQKLKVLANLMERIAVYKLKNGFTQWFSNGLNPIKCKNQSELLSIKVYSNDKKFKLFYQWRKRYLQRLGSYESKTQAIQAIWDVKTRDTQVESKRAFLIWKECLSHQKLKLARVKKLIYKLYFNKVNLAMNAWSNHSDNLDSQVRLGLLSKEFSRKQYMTLMLHGFRYQTTESKRKRDNILFHAWKGWKDYIQHRKFLMGANIAVMKFGQECGDTVMRQCFDAWKQYKAHKQFHKTNVQLNDVELVHINQLNNDIDIIETDTKFKAKSKACESIKRMMGKSLYRYLDQWRQVNEVYKETLKTKVKDRIIKSYLLLLRSGFTLWRKNRDFVKDQEKQLEIQEFENDQNVLQGDIHDLQKDIKSKQEFKDCSQKKNLNKCVLAFEKRQIQIALGRWRDYCSMSSTKEAGASTIIRKVKNRYLRQGFDLYLAGVKYHKKRLVEEERCKQYNHKRNDILLKKVINNWVVFKTEHMRAKRYWDRIYTRLDVHLKQRAVKKWREQSLKMNESDLLKSKQNVLGQIDSLNNEIGNLHQQETDQKQDLNDINSKMTKQAQRIIANAFARFYYIGETRGFEAWKNYVQDQKRKERLMKKIIDHMRKQQYYYAKSCIQNWMMNCNVQEKRDQLKKEEQKLADEKFQLEAQNKQFQQLRSKLNSELEQIKKLQQNYNGKLQKSIQMIVNKVDTQDYMSRKRFLLQQWSQFVKREKNFINCVQRVISKSLWSKGLDAIKDRAREVQQQTQMKTTLERFRMKFWKRTCGNAISVWRSGAYTSLNQIIEEVQGETNEVYQDHQQKKAHIKEVNAEKAGKILIKKGLKEWFSGWKQGVGYLKLQKAKTQKLNQQLLAFQKCRALSKWSSRNKATKIAVMRVERLRARYRILRTRTYFNAMRAHFEAAKNFVSRMANLANIHDHQAIKMGINAIFSYAKAKKYVLQKRKEVASKDILSILENLLMRKQQLYFNDLKYRTYVKYQQNVKKIYTIKYSLSNKIRTYFLRWKQYNDKINLIHEVHHEGEVREEYFGDRQELNNCKTFMKDEGYTEKEVQEVLKEGTVVNRHLLLKGVRRMQHYTEDLYVKPKAFDRWKKYVYYRKAFRYWANFVNGRGEFLKINLAKSFNRWKQFGQKSKVNLTSLHYDDLKKKNIHNSKNLEVLAEVVEDKENVIQHLNNQRDVLLENYVKGQKIALFIWQNKCRLRLEEGFTKWKLNCQKQNNNSLKDQTLKNIELITALKERINALERDNNDIATENEELRQFSLDGYEIAKSVQALNQERELLSVDLADKAQIIRKLLDENEKLTFKLRNAQDEAQSLIKSTNSKIKGNGNMSFASPAMRSNAN